MSAQRPDPLRNAMLAAAIGLAAALATGLGLGALGKAGDLNRRLAATDGETARAEALLKAPGRESALPPGAICRGAPSEAARRLHDALAAQAAQGGLAPDLLEVIPDETAGGPAPIRVRLAATGSYEAAIGLLALIGRQKPAVFADSVDLTPKVSNVTLAFSGRAFCAS